MNVLKAVAAGVLLALVSCSSSDLGTGINTVDRDYKDVSVKQAHDASLATMKDQDLQLEKDKYDDMGGEIVASRKSNPDNKVIVNLKAVENNTCQVKVRVQPGDKDQAEMLQSKIGEKVLPAAK